MANFEPKALEAVHFEAIKVLMPEPIMPTQFAEIMGELNAESDYERARDKADILIAGLLYSLGYQEGAEAFWNSEFRKKGY